MGTASIKTKAKNEAIDNMFISENQIRKGKSFEEHHRLR